MIAGLTVALGEILVPPVASAHVPSPRRNLSWSPAFGAVTVPEVPSASAVAPVICAALISSPLKVKLPSVDSPSLSNKSLLIPANLFFSVVV